jgi:multidrug resistance protein, MATE family
MSELSTIGRHAITALAGQLAVMAFGVTDTMEARRHGEVSLAALSVCAPRFLSASAWH